MKSEKGTGTNKNSINSNQTNSNKNHCNDYHNIFEENTTNMRISLDNKNETIQTNSDVVNSLKAPVDLKSNKQIESKKINFDETESNKICITSLHINSVETESDKNKITKTEETEKHIQISENEENIENQRYIRENNQYTETSNNLNMTSETLNENLNENENINLPEYLPTEINNIASTQDEKNSIRETESNYENTITKTENYDDHQTNDYANYVLNTELDSLRVSSSFNNKNIQKNIEYISENLTESAFEPLKTNESIVCDKRNNLKEQVNDNLVIKKTVKFNKIIENNNKKNKNEENNNSVNIRDNNMNTETTNKTRIKTKLDYSLKKNDNNKGNDYLKAGSIKNQYNNYIRNVDRTKVNKFKKGFFDTSVSYEKGNDIRNKTFDGRFGSSSKSKEKGENITKKNNLISYKRNIMTNQNNVKAYYTGYKDNLNKNINILNTDASGNDDTKNSNVTNTTKDRINKTSIRNQKIL